VGWNTYVHVHPARSTSMRRTTLVTKGSYLLWHGRYAHFAHIFMVPNSNWLPTISP
jgi:hypothetical protein